MANELILTQEEKEFIRKRRVREARKNKKREELVAEAFEKLPTLSEFLKIAGVSELTEDNRRITSNLRGLFVNADGLIAFKEEYYGTLYGASDVPVWTISYKNIRKICGQKIPFDCRLEIEVVNHKVIAFKVLSANSVISFARGTYELIRGCAYYRFPTRWSTISYEVPLYNLDKNNLKNKFIASIHLTCSQVYEYYENQIACANERLQKLLKIEMKQKQCLVPIIRHLKERRENDEKIIVVF